MDDVAIVVGLVLGAVCWWWLVRCMRINGRPWWWRHLAGLLLASFAMAGLSMLLASLLGVTDENGEPLGVVGAVGGLVVALPMLIPLAVSWRAARRVPAPVAAPEVAPNAEPAAEPEPVSAENGNLRFVYEDADGNVSTREVRSWNASGRYIKGYCLDRQALRTFRRDRVVEFLDGEHLLGSGPSPAAVPGPRQDRPLEILFTGFDADARQELEEEAELEGMVVRKSVTQHLDFLCAGPNAGPRKLAEARGKGVVVMSEAEFFDFLDTGVLPSGAR